MKISLNCFKASFMFFFFNIREISILDCENVKQIFDKTLTFN